ncbi:MAG: hypothetical protein SOV26_01850 [Candidatus Onthovivens sp.]|nr:hypothetical protein [Candidatus Onthovivens sp.]
MNTCTQKKFRTKIYSSDSLGTFLCAIFLLGAIKGLIYVLILLSKYVSDTLASYKEVLIFAIN